MIRPSTPPAYGTPVGPRMTDTSLIYDQLRHLADRARRFEREEPYRRRRPEREDSIPLSFEASIRRRWIDPAKPLLLRAENDMDARLGVLSRQSRRRHRLEKLIMAAKYFTPPIEGQRRRRLPADRSTFNEFPDLLVTRRSLQGSSRKSATPTRRRPNLLWGTSELVHFKNTDGVPLAATLYQAGELRSQEEVPDDRLHLRDACRRTCTTFVDPRPGHSRSTRAYYVSNGYLVFDAGHRLHDRLSRARAR